MGDGSFKTEVRVNQSACQNAQEEGRINLFGDKRQYNGDNRRQE